MRCLVTAGPTFEPLDEVRRLTNFSTGRLGCGLAAHLTRAGHEVTLLIGEQATWAGERLAANVEVFSTTMDLSHRFERLAAGNLDAVFHAAAVSDFTVARIWERTPAGRVRPAEGGKLATGGSTFLACLVPTPKLIGRLRTWFPQAFLAGWKYEVDGDTATVLAKAWHQIQQNRTDVCIANGVAYGNGYGLVQLPDCHQPLPDEAALFQALERLAVARLSA